MYKTVNAIVSQKAVSCNIGKPPAVRSGGLFDIGPFLLFVPGPAALHEPSILPQFLLLVQDLFQDVRKAV